MGGRFFSYSVILSLLFIFIYYHERLIKRINYFFPLIILYLILFPNSTIYIPSKPSMSIKGIGDEKIVYHKTTSLVYNWKNKSGLNKEKTRILSNKDFLNKNIIITPIIGMTGYFLGPKIHILDPLALTDPLLARLPGKGRVGHKYRLIPEGYYESILTGKNQIESKNLKDYYNDIQLLTKDKIFSIQRFYTIGKFLLPHKNKFENKYKFSTNYGSTEMMDLFNKFPKEQLIQVLEKEYLKN